VDDSSKTIAYAGAWRGRRSPGALKRSVHVAATADSRLTFSFGGSEARVYGTTAPGRGTVDVFVDGSYAATVDTYSFVRRAQRIWFDTGVLRARRHTLELRCRGDKNILSSGTAIAFDKLDVVRS